MTGLSTVTSLTQIQDGYLKTVTDALTRMSELATLAQDQTKNTTDRTLYQKEFNQLNELIYETQDKKFTGIHLFKTLSNDYQSVSVTIDENGEQFTIPPIDFSDSKFTDAIKTPGSENSLSTAADAKATAALINTLIDHAQQERTVIGSIQSRVEFALSQLSTSKENLNQAKSRITDVDIALETTKFARHQILVQSGTQMLREANNLPQTALELLR